MLRMASLLAGAAALWGVAATPVVAGPVVLELYTSQGCNSCPPADELLGYFVEQDDVVALSMHVDYWDYLGWTDAFAKPEHTRRQRQYQKMLGSKAIYTPQMVVNGQAAVVGSKTVQVMEAVDSVQSAPNVAEVVLTREGDELVAGIAPTVENLEGPATIWLIGYSGPHSVPIRNGENAGRTLTYHNVARSFTQVGVWDAASPVQFRAAIDAEMRGYAVIVQKHVVGVVYGAQKIEF